jgi:hypothetical protein
MENFANTGSNILRFWTGLNSQAAQPCLSLGFVCMLGRTYETSLLPIIKAREI